MMRYYSAPVTLVVSLLALAGRVGPLAAASKEQVSDQTCSNADGQSQCAVDVSETPDVDYEHEIHYIDIDFGQKQQVAGKDWKKTLDNLEKAKAYMKTVHSNSTLQSVRNDCQCRNELCSFWAAIGECEANPGFMKSNCAPSCQTCDQLSFELRCPYDKNAPSIWQPGDLDRMFQRITTDSYYVQTFQPTIWSKPPEGPWVVTLENVATAEECQAMIEAGRVLGYERSKDVGARKFDGTFDAAESKDRTSSNAWCVEECYRNEFHQRVLKVVENITGIPEPNSEYWQLLKYEEGQFYRHHHDYVNFHTERSQGVRMLTVFLYLNTVEEGGGTRFTDLDITVEARRGRALLWPSVLNDKPSEKDRRTHHEALPVIKGIKYGANGWYHERDFKTPYGQGCS